MLTGRIIPANVLCAVPRTTGSRCLPMLHVTLSNRIRASSRLRLCVGVAMIAVVGTLLMLRNLRRSIRI